MILLNSFIALFAIFIAPQIFIYYIFDKLKYSLVILYGLVLSFSMTWVLFIFIFIFKIPDIIIYSFALLISLASLIYMYIHQSKHYLQHGNYIYWMIAFLFLIPAYNHIGSGFTQWDAVNAWNRWAIELYHNTYNPIDAAYPILLPSIWAMIYKIQGTSDIWWTAQVTLFVLPLIILAILGVLYHENKNKTFIYIGIVSYPYLLTSQTYSGYMDMPVMLMGLLSLIVLYAAELHKNEDSFKHYIYTSLLIAGIATVVKQAGFIFLLFDFVYIVLNLKHFSNKKELGIITLLPMLYFISYLPFYYIYGNYGATENLGHLKAISTKIDFNDKHIYKKLGYLWKMFFSHPYNIRTVLHPLAMAIHLPPMTPYFVALGTSLFIFKPLRKINSVTFLSFIFFILGVVIWAQYFSYSERNSFWVKSFFILFFSININYLFNKYKPSFFAVTLFLLSLAVVYLFSVNDAYVYAKQKNFQQHIGDRQLVHYIKDHLLKNKSKCVKILTNRQNLKFNYDAKDIQNRFFIDRLYPLYSIKHNMFSHTCKDGRYLILRPSTKWKSPSDWKKVRMMELTGNIKRIKHKKDYIYYIPPQSDFKTKKQ